MTRQRDDGEQPPNDEPDRPRVGEFATEPTTTRPGSRHDPPDATDRPSPERPWRQRKG